MEMTVHCAQVGARDHYAWPRALNRVGLLGSMTTDIWLAHPRWRGIGRLGGRFHPGLAAANVRSANVACLLSQMAWRSRGLDAWDRIMRADRAFQRWALARVPWDANSGNKPPVLFAYSYAARDLLRRAKSLGWITVLGQIDLGPGEWEIVDGVAGRHPEFRPASQAPPASYFEGWREELALADHVIVNSQWSADAMLAEGVPIGKLHVTPVPFEEPGLVPRSRQLPGRFTNQRPLRVLFLGQANLRKGIADLLEAMRAMDGEPIELVMAGRLQVTLPDWARRLGNVRLLGQVAREHVGRVYQAADVFILPTHSDGFGLTQVEAQAWALPLIASRHCGHVVQHEVNGLLLDRVDSDAIRAALTRCLHQPQELATWARASRVDERFSLAAAAKGFAEMLGADWKNGRER